MFCGDNVHVYVHVVVNFYGLGVVNCGLPRGAICGEKLLVRALAAQGFNVNVLHIRPKVSKSPGDMIVVPDDDQRQSRDGDPGYVQGLAGFEVALVPDAGHGER